MKILMVTDMYPPAIGGMENEIQTLAEGLVKQKNCDVSVCTLRLNSTPTFEKRNGVRVYREEGLFQKISFIYRNVSRKFHPPAVDWLITKKLARTIQKEKPDVVHAHNWMLYSVLPLRKKFDFALCATFHDLGFICPRRSSDLYDGGICTDPLTRKCLTCGKESYGLVKSFFAYLGVKIHRDFVCDTIVFSNPHILDKMKHLKQRKIYLEHPIDTRRYRPLAANTHKKRILCWVKLEKIKGVDRIFKVAEKLNDYQFDIPSIGGHQEYYKSIKPPNVRLIPKLETSERPQILCSYPIILGQLHIGAFGLSELEAMSCGKPVVAYWNRQYDKFYDEPCPILSSKKTDEIVDLIISNIGNEALGKVNRRWTVRYHSALKVVEKLFKIYESTLDRRKD